MNITEFTQVLPHLLQSKLVPYLHGSQGLGKTSVVAQYAAANQLGFVPLYMANLEPGDFLGLLIKKGNDEVTHARPAWFPTEGRGIIFLDELNRAHPDVKQALFSFVLEGRIHTHVLPEGWSIVAAGNYDSENFVTTAFDDDAWLSRFAHIDFKPTVNEFYAYAESKGASTITDFLREQPTFMDSNQTSAFDFTKLKFDRRRWLQFIHPLEQVEMEASLRFELYQGLIGTTAAATFQSWKAQSMQALKIDDLLAEKKAATTRVDKLLAEEPIRLDVLNGPISELVSKLEADEAYLTPKKTAALKKLLIKLPLELGHRLFKDLSNLKFKEKTNLLNDPVFVESIALKAKTETLRIGIK